MQESWLSLLNRIRLRVSKWRNAFQVSLIRNQIAKHSVPYHIGIIMDGNRRYARNMGFKNVIQGHQAGVDQLYAVLRWCRKIGVKMVTVWGFSTENIHRNPEEVQGILGLIEKKALDIITDPEIHTNQIQVRALGNLSLLPESTQSALKQMEASTQKYNRFFLNIAVGYGGKQEVIDSIKHILHKAQSEQLSYDTVINQLDDTAIQAHLYVPELPEPELIIRTSGEIRTSGFLLWQAAYSEYFFCKSYWPSFSELDLLTAIREYQKRQRRFGR